MNPVLFVLLVLLNPAAVSGLRMKETKKGLVRNAKPVSFNGSRSREEVLESMVKAFVKSIEHVYQQAKRQNGSMTSDNLTEDDMTPEELAGFFSSLFSGNVDEARHVVARATKKVPMTQKEQAVPLELISFDTAHEANDVLARRTTKLAVSNKSPCDLYGPRTREDVLESIVRELGIPAQEIEPTFTAIEELFLEANPQNGTVTKDSFKYAAHHHHQFTEKPPEEQAEILEIMFRGSIGEAMNLEIMVKNVLAVTNPRNLYESRTREEVLKSMVNDYGLSAEFIEQIFTPIEDMFLQAHPQNGKVTKDNFKKAASRYVAEDKDLTLEDQIEILDLMFKGSTDEAISLEQMVRNVLDENMDDGTRDLHGSPRREEAKPVSEQIKELIANHHVMVFSKAFCPSCTTAKKAFETIGADFEVLELQDANGRPIVSDPDAYQDYFQKITGARTVPRVFIGGKSIGGGDDVNELLANGQLAKLCEEVGAIPGAHKHDKAVMRYDAEFKQETPQKLTKFSDLMVNGSAVEAMTRGHVEENGLAAKMAEARLEHLYGSKTREEVFEFMVGDSGVDAHITEPIFNAVEDIFKHANPQHGKVTRDSLHEAASRHNDKYREKTGADQAELLDRMFSGSDDGTISLECLAKNVLDGAIDDGSIYVPRH